MSFSRIIISILNLIGQRDLARAYSRHLHNKRLQRYYSRNPYT